MPPNEGACCRTPASNLNMVSFLSSRESAVRTQVDLGNRPEDCTHFAFRLHYSTARVKVEVVLQVATRWDRSPSPLWPRCSCSGSRDKI
jgi:hypothetical protein